ncbi:hypothetical protein [Paenibacillus sp. MMO-58]|uniref:hypothetical protein n=1 Tax=Paenibacillus sp. MMO-58 TaxID=3081290 RepID=UPI0030162611
MNRLSQKAFTETEGDIAGFYSTLQEIVRIRGQLLHESAAGGSAPGEKKDPTANRAIALVDNGRLNHLKRVAKAVSEVYDKLPEKRKQLVRYYYWDFPGQKPNWNDLAAVLNEKRNQVVKWRNEMVYEVAGRLGRS